MFVNRYLFFGIANLYLFIGLSRTQVIFSGKVGETGGEVVTGDTNV